jgi:hypothetical protein
MAAKRNGRDRLEEAMTLLIQNQATFLTRLSETDKELALLRKQTDERFARIENVLSQLIQLVQGLPDAVKDKIGFRPKQ